MNQYPLPATRPGAPDESDVGPRNATLAERLSTPTGHKPQWIPALDGYRGIGTLAVMSTHFLSQFERYLEANSIFVDGFFVMSGYLITSILLVEQGNKESVSLRRFYIRRALRLLPALYMLLAVFVVYAVVLGGSERGHFLVEAGAASIYVYNFFVAWVGVSGNALIQLWTLSIETQFYVAWPLFFVFALRRSRSGAVRPQRMRLLVAAMVGFIVVLPLLRMGLYHLADTGIGDRTAASFIFGLSIMRPDSVVLGCLVAFALHIWHEPLAPRAEKLLSRAGDMAFAIIIASVLLGSLPAFERYVSPFNNLAILCTGPFIFDLVRNPHKRLSRILRWRPLVWLGERSYAMYIWHLLVFFVIHDLVAGMLPGRTRAVELIAAVISTILTILIAVASLRFVEQPAMRLKKRFGA